ncbi:sulfopyruvate decarboxylase subunit beta [Methanosphaera sp. BMS]|uniref:sulfopyruvate decarboxylase subunit beta n=1 Tax=Methanosphaera sp. BMS TaxID=1789762 RepID=UPI000DD4C48E|nr:sulfopyruvate decarboxylase subunit beta [Methanosphaera sp. BMS]
MKRYDVIRAVVKDLNDELIISNIGVPSKELHEIRESKNNFYMLGSMSMATPIGLGLSMALEKNNDNRKVIVLDGDGSVLMNLGELVTVYVQNPTNLIVVIIDNEAYGSTGSQKTYASEVNIANIARSVGIKEVYYIDAKDNTDHIDMNEYLNKKGPIVLHIKVNAGNSDAKNIKYTPSKIKNRFMKSIQKR